MPRTEIVFTRAMTGAPRTLFEAAVPCAWLLANGSWTTLVSAAGTGGSWYDNHALTRWAGDRVEDGDGFFIYVRDRESGALWSLGHQPVQRAAERYAAAWRPGVVEIARMDFGIEARLEVCVVHDAPIEIRRVTLRNHSERRRILDLTSYVEVALNRAAADAAHPAYSKLFVQTEVEPGHGALLAKRRPRNADERHPWLTHALIGDGALEHETDRARFIGRGLSLARPRALRTDTPLSGTTGSVLDPVLALRRFVELKPGGEAELSFLLGAAPGRSQALSLIARHAEPEAIAEAIELEQDYARGELKRLGLSESEAENLQLLAGAMLFSDPRLRATPGRTISAEAAPPSRACGSSSGRPLIVLDARQPVALRQLPEVLRAQRYWQSVGLSCELLVLSDDPALLPDPSPGDEDHGLRVQRISDLAPSQLEHILVSASLALTDLRDVLRAPGWQDGDASCDALPHEPDGPGRSAASAGTEGSGIPFTELLKCFNGHGGFTAAGDEYVIRLPHDRETGLQRIPPKPWINVIANPSFGFLVSETGAGYTWSANSREHRITPWSNDPVLDPHGEALYIRDEESGTFWSPLPGPVPTPADYELRHGFGYSRCRHVSQGLEQVVTLFVPPSDPVKLVHLKLVNRSGRARRLSLFGYQRLVLGELPQESSRFVVTELDTESRALLARNPLAGEFSHRIAFASVVVPEGARTHWSADREAFIGRNGSPARPRAVSVGSELDGRVGAGLDPCFAEQVVVEIERDQTLECTFLLGEGEGLEEVRALLARYSLPGATARALDEVRQFWTDTLTRVQIETPSPATDVMVNGWLLYQTLSCRIWGRSAFYQSGGAFGFRDQLQDATAFTMVRPEWTREQILLHAAHQFEEGDVLHWWHPPLDRGIRTRFADDRLWLPFVTAGYVRNTGDREILDQRAPFLEARVLAPGEDEAFLTPSRSRASADLYQHCCRAIDCSLATGAHGLPLFGTGDWNDGMNAVGREGRGESVWVGFFLFAVLGEFAEICTQRGDHDRARSYAVRREQLRAALDDGGWDGEWYRRGYYDDGAPLGSSSSDECRIDALAQSWAVFSGAAPPERARRAMDAVERHLVSERDGLIRLLAPPFDRTPHHPGYIKGYVPGVRENGGQYTHAALWVVRALAELGRNDRAARLLEMLSPLTHSATPEQVLTYQVEPYVVAADLCGAPPHTGQGGWTWYTGSAGWWFRVALESVLGIRVEHGKTMLIRPCIPADWPGFRVRIRLPEGGTVYQIEVRNPDFAAHPLPVEARADGVPVPVVDGTARIPLLEDGRTHIVHVILGDVLQQV